MASTFLQFPAFWKIHKFCADGQRSTKGAKVQRVAFLGESITSLNAEQTILAFARSFAGRKLNTENSTSLGRFNIERFREDILQL
jgi:ligand-binding SRPBCC domain-containing protein